jgi:hypothetical protein
MGNTNGGQYASVKQQSPDAASASSAAKDALKENLKKFGDIIKTGAGADAEQKEHKNIAAGDELWNSIGSFAAKQLGGESAWKWDRTVLEDLVLDIGKDKDEFTLQSDRIKKIKKGESLQGDGAPSEAEQAELKEVISDRNRQLPDPVIIKILELDEDLSELRFKIVPRFVSEENFWIIYSIKVFHVASAHIKAYSAAASPSEEQPKGDDKPSSE